MSDGLKLIGRLEEEMGIELKQVSMEKIGHWKVNGFAADNEGRVRGLAIWEKKLSPLPEYLSKFQNLEILALNKTQISDISSLKKLKGLKVLYLYINQISDISSLKELKMLTFLHLSNNQISDVSSLKELKNLKRLYLIGNKISYIPAEFLDMGMDIKWGLGTQHEGIYLADNPLESPPVEIIKKGNQAIREYFNSLAEKSQALNEVKVLLVGDGAAGKTSLMKQLMGKPFDKKESQTHGININTLAVSQKNSKIKARLWDFGGQEIMHATHRFFLSKRSLYILVLD
ncbi:MAG: hypothetical protein GY757_34165, partial [bacterium]|nr:hypothetical protein [bacterium]